MNARQRRKQRRSREDEFSKTLDMAKTIFCLENYLEKMMMIGGEMENPIVGKRGCEEANVSESSVRAFARIHSNPNLTLEAAYQAFLGKQQ